MPCSERSVVSVNDDPFNGVGCDLLYWSDGGNGWDGGDVNPVWSYWPSKELGNPQNPGSDFYTVTISENGDYVATGGAVPTSTYLLDKNGILQQIIGLGQQNIQSVDLTFTGKYGASVDSGGTIWFFDKDTGFMWSAVPTGAPFHCVAISKLYPCMFPYPNHDVATISVTTDKTGCLPMETIGQNLTTAVRVKVSNQGDFPESFEVTVYANLVLIGKSTVMNLPSKTQTTLTFVWDTAGLAFGNYTIHAYASLVYDEIDVADNNFVDSRILITLPGDINGDRFVNAKDAVILGIAFGSQQGQPTYNPNADINGDGYCNAKDAIPLGTYFSKSW
jgi:hypothetical protein